METVKKDGVARLYKGLDAGLIRQASYTTARMGIFKTLMDMGQQRSSTGYVPFWQKTAFSLAAGGLGSVIGNPADLALIRLQTDHTLPEGQKRGYNGVFDTLARIVKEEGVAALWTGCTPTVYRAMSINVGMLCTNEQSKDMLKSMFGEF
jgi:solute carrier family 25 oxoglutarate transporter 11|mmetsp:Transcript_17241/g.2852  ORF Transcript_17241/g.2852 Transcript_17241/m.2852 type:complete len:150 (+) Transcript_17241:171-620(+)|eukprot:CAMPEP_0168315046 /NCGR_PEP_ID=MMETSP0210-20121227/9983_1 /TAXON_ID=40633 /ORGANISM="Condylostoma magnum, Strain COL2" /LENGTH=149 /DNA_ID=CAMNT_0008286079 /DNA_START=164 /DNA_END=613 /DNA_ORIENTATION=+